MASIHASYVCATCQTQRGGATTVICARTIKRFENVLHAAAAILPVVLAPIFLGGEAPLLEYSGGNRPPSAAAPALPAMQEY